jgi:hypothetical protein
VSQIPYAVHWSPKRPSERLLRGGECREQVSPCQSGLGSAARPAEKPLSQLLQAAVPILFGFGPDPLDLGLECWVAPVESGRGLGSGSVALVRPSQKGPSGGPIESRVTPVRKGVTLRDIAAGVLIDKGSGHAGV